jgi:hypothetical protein
VIVPPDLLGAVLDALADRIAARIDSTRERETYDSRKLPPRTSRRRFAEVCRSGRVLDARREGRDWTCSRAAWEAARARRPAPAASSATAKTLDEAADRLLGRAGLHVVRGGGR